jgi:hypothetical protein
MDLYRKVDAETDIGEDSRTVDEIVARLVGQTAEEVCSRTSPTWITSKQQRTGVTRPGRT